MGVSENAPKTSMNWKSLVSQPNPAKETCLLALWPIASLGEKNLHYEGETTSCHLFRNRSELGRHYKHDQSICGLRAEKKNEP